MYNDADAVRALHATKTLATAAKALPGPAGWIAAIVAEALGMATASADAGLDPVVRMRRMRKHEELLASGRKRILDALIDKAKSDS